MRKCSRCEPSNAWTDINSFDAFVATLQGVCGSGINFHESFGKFLNEAYRLLEKYWDTIRDQKMSQKGKLSQSALKIKLLEQHPEIESFYKEFGLH